MRAGDNSWESSPACSKSRIGCMQPGGVCRQRTEIQPSQPHQDFTPQRGLVNGNQRNVLNRLGNPVTC
jgi:hypothetical protein